MNTKCVRLFIHSYPFNGVSFCFLCIRPQHESETFAIYLSLVGLIRFLLGLLLASMLTSCFLYVIGLSVMLCGEGRLLILFGSLQCLSISSFFAGL